MKKGKIGLSIAGLIISVLGIFLILFFMFVAPIILSAQVDLISKKLDSSPGMACLNAISSVRIVSACRDDSGIHLIIGKAKNNVGIEFAMFFLDSIEVVKKNIDREVLIDSFDGNIEGAKYVQIAPVLTFGNQCEIASNVRIENC